MFEEMTDFIDVQRVLMAFLSGYFISFSGSLSQISTHNNLASPSTLGMTGGAVFTIIISQFLIIFGGVDLSLEKLSFTLFLLSLLPLGFIFFRRKKAELWKDYSSKNIILIGVIFNLLVGAVFTIIQFLFISMNYEFPSQLWFGNFRYPAEFSIWIFISIFILVGLIRKSLTRKLEIMNLGEGFALGLGLDIRKTQLSSLFISYILIGTVICFFGVFSFLGLIFPHILRSFNLFKADVTKELKYGPYLCGLVLSVIDFLCYHFTIQGVELPVGMVSSVAGSLLMIWIILKSNALGAK